jgi:hypothetical protein
MEHVKQFRKGPVPRGHVDTHILLPLKLREWAKEEPEGLAGLVRTLLQAEYERRTGQRFPTTDTP